MKKFFTLTAVFTLFFTAVSADIAGHLLPTPKKFTAGEKVLLQGDKYSFGGNFKLSQRKKSRFCGTVAEMTDNLIAPVADYVNRDAEYRDTPPLAPGIAPTADQNEEINLIATPLISNVNSWTLKFITGQEDINAKWDEYVKSCEDLNAQGLVDIYAQLYKGK